MSTIAVLFLGKVGDVLNTSPFCETLKLNNSDSRIIYITHPAGYEMANCLSSVDCVYTFDYEDSEKGLVNLVKNALSLRKKEKIDKIFVLSESFRSALYAYLAGAKSRIGRAVQGRDFLLTHRIGANPSEFIIHISDYFLELLKDFNFEKIESAFKIDFSEESLTYTMELLKAAGCENTKLIGLNPCSANPEKDWIVEEAVKFINLVNEHSGYKVVLIGEKVGKKFAEKIKAAGTDNFVDLTCSTNISELVALISKFENLVSVDTGSAHISYALKIPSVTLFFNDLYKKWGPKDQEIHKIIYSPSGISAEQVIKELQL